MVMLTRGWAKLLTLVGFFLELIGPVVSIAQSEDDEPAESERASAIHEQSVEQAPPPASMPVGNRFIFAQPQNYRHVPQDESWFMGTPHALRMQIAARRLPVLYVPPSDHRFDDGPEPANDAASVLVGDGFIPTPGPGVGPSARHQFHVPVRDTTLKAG